MALRVTFPDLIDYLVDHAQAYGVGISQSILRRLADEAIKRIALDGWQWYVKQETLEVSVFSTLATYDPATRTMTAADAWPSWAVEQPLWFLNQRYEVESVSGQNLVVASPAPTSAVTTPTLVQLSQTRIFPSARIGAVLDAVWNNVTPLDPLPERMTFIDIFARSTPNFFSIHPSRRANPGERFLVLHPMPSAAGKVNLVYERAYEPPAVSGMQAEHWMGTVSVTTGSTTVTGSGTSFDNRMAGAVLRISSNQDLPTGMFGPNPPRWEVIIKSVTSATSLEVEEASPITVSGAQYRVASDLDIPWYLADAVIAQLRWNLASFIGNPKAMQQAAVSLRDSLVWARQADAGFSSSGTSAGRSRARAIQPVYLTVE